jgi:hypothetical protein
MPWVAAVLGAALLVTLAIPFWSGVAPGEDQPPPKDWENEIKVIKDWAENEKAEAVAATWDQAEKKAQAALAKADEKLQATLRECEQDKDVALAEAEWCLQAALEAAQCDKEEALARAAQQTQAALAKVGKEKEAALRKLREETAAALQEADEKMERAARKFEQEKVDALAEAERRLQEALAAARRDKEDALARVVAKMKKVPPQQAASSASGHDLQVVMSWNTNNTDIDLHVYEPDGTKVFYGNRQPANGGQLVDDVTNGYGPEVYQARQAKRGQYRIVVHYFSASGPPTEVSVLVVQWPGTPQQQIQRHRVTVTPQQEREVCRVGF